jgi:hypothetical protein
MAVFFNLILGPYGGIVVLGLTFGLIFSTHQRNKMIYEDLQNIKEKLGITDPLHTLENLNDTEEIENTGIEDEHLRKINEEIEKELEEYHSKVDEMEKKKK